jgi:hypothetical protein
MSQCALHEVYRYGYRDCMNVVVAVDNLLLDNHLSPLLLNCLHSALVGSPAGVWLLFPESLSSASYLNSFQAGDEV